MKCPKCGKEMREGRLAAKRPIIFTERKRVVFCGEEDVRIAGLLESNPEARICEHCRMVIVDY